MTQQRELAVALRSTEGKANKQLRKKGLIPGNITGHNEKPQAIQVEAVAFEALRRSGATTNLIQLTMSDAPAQTVLIRHVHRAPTSDQILHIDFSRIGVDERQRPAQSSRSQNKGLTAVELKHGGCLLPMCRASRFLA